MGMGIYITRKLLGRLNSRRSVRAPEYIYMLVTPMVSFLMLSIEMCPPIAMQLLLVTRNLRPTNSSRV